MTQRAESPTDKSTTSLLPEVRSSKTHGKCPDDVHVCSSNFCLDLLSCSVRDHKKVSMSEGIGRGKLSIEKNETALKGCKGHAMVRGKWEECGWDISFEGIEAPRKVQL